MKLHTPRNLLCTVTVLGLALAASASPASSFDDVAPINGVNDATAKGANKAGPIGTEHAPVDGKDGIPKSGPWIETSAERERKKSTELLDDTADYIKDITDSVDSKLPQSNDGVMDDKSRTGPKDENRGIGGGISKKPKNADIAYTDSKKPDAPKGQPPLPPSEFGKLTTDGKDTVDDTLVDEDHRKPSDTTDKSNNLPYTDSSLNLDSTIPLDETRLHNHPSANRPDSPTSPLTGTIPHEDIVQPMHSMFLAFTMILVSEIGDKTFLVACLMAMRHDRILVFSAAYAALITMTVLSAVLGHAVPTLIPKWLTNFLAAGLFLVFGVKMLLEARGISPDEGVSEEMKEVEQELEEKEHEALRNSRRRSSITPHILESGRGGGLRKSRSETGRLPSPPDSPISESSSRAGSPSRSTLSNITSGVNNLFSLLLSPAWVQTFVMTFLGEWGDRSQIATIAMAAGSDYWWVTAGALGGHAICTGVAVIGGKAIAGRVSLRTGKFYFPFFNFSLVCLMCTCFVMKLC